MFNDRFVSDLEVAVVKVNPETNSVDDVRSKNTKVQIWLEHGPYEEKYHSCNHDPDLDCRADTFEEAIIELAKLVKKHYNTEGEKYAKTKGKIYRGKRENHYGYYE